MPNMPQSKISVENAGLYNYLGNSAGFHNDFADFISGEAVDRNGDAAAISPLSDIFPSNVIHDSCLNDFISAVDNIVKMRANQLDNPNQESLVEKAIQTTLTFFEDSKYKNDKDVRDEVMASVIYAFQDTNDNITLEEAKAGGRYLNAHPDEREAFLNGELTIGTDELREVYFQDNAKTAHLSLVSASNVADTDYLTKIKNDIKLIRIMDDNQDAQAAATAITGLVDFRIEQRDQASDFLKNLREHFDNVANAMNTLEKNPAQREDGPISFLRAAALAATSTGLGDKSIGNIELNVLEGSIGKLTGVENSRLPIDWQVR